MENWRDIFGWARRENEGGRRERQRGKGEGERERGEALTRLVAKKVNGVLNGFKS